MRDLHWHPVAKLQIEIEQFLRGLSKKRKSIVQSALRRMTDLRRVVGYGTHKKRVVRPASSRAPLSARTFDTVMPFSPRYPKFEPIKYRRRKEKQSARKQVEVLEHGHIDHSALPREIQEFNKQREEKHWARAAAARRKNLDLEEKLKHEDAMLNMNCPARGKVHKLRKKGLPIVKEHWRLLNFVLSEDGDLVHDNEEPGGAPVTLGNLSSVIKIQQRTFDLFPVGGVELVFKYRNADGGRTHECLYLAWGDAEAEEYTFWMDVLKRYTWRCARACSCLCVCEH